MKRAEMKPYLKRRSDSRIKMSLFLISSRSLPKTRNRNESGQTAKDGEVPLCNKIVEICPLPIFLKCPGSVEFRQRKGVDLVSVGERLGPRGSKYKDGPADKGVK